MIVKPFVAKLMGGMMAVGIAVTALAGQSAKPADACTPYPLVCQNPEVINALRPDLTPVSVRVQRVDATHIKVTMQVKNQGVMPAVAGTDTVLYYNLVAEKVFIEGQIAPGQVVIHEHMMFVGNATSASFGLGVDQATDATESNENNNWLLKTLNF